MIERDKLACIIGEISSASCLTIAQVATRNKTLFINTGGNSDALRGPELPSASMFHVESQNSMHVRRSARSFLRDGLVKGKKWYSLTADYAFGHDLLSVSKRFMRANGGNFAGDELVPTDATDFSAYLLKIREAKPDLVVINLAGNQITNFLRQHAEFGLTFPVGGFGFDTALAWAAGKGNFVGTWPVVWHHLLDTPGSKGFVAALHQESTASRRIRPRGRLHRHQDRGAEHQRAEIGRVAEDHRAFREGREVRSAERHVPATSAHRIIG